MPGTVLGEDLTSDIDDEEFRARSVKGHTHSGSEFGDELRVASESSNLSRERRINGHQHHAPRSGHLLHKSDDCSAPRLR